LLNAAGAVASVSPEARQQHRSEWGGYFSPGSHYVTNRAIEAHIYDRVRNFLVRRHEMPARSIEPR
jgi:hypothetical protein